MKYIQPLNEPENSPYTDGDTAQGIEGSIVPAAALEHPQRELLAVIEAAGLTPDNLDLMQLLKAMRALFEPVGSLKDWAGTIDNIPSGYLLCDGREISRAIYADLFAITGTLHGLGDGASTFNLPDLTNKFVLGASTTRAAASSGGSFEKSGATDGHILTVKQIAEHEHFIASGAGGQGFLTATNRLAVRANSNVHHDSNRDYNLEGTSGVANIGKTSEAGGNQPHPHNISNFDVTPPYYSLAKIIRT